MQSLYTSASTMAQLQKQLDTTGHNLANANTNGYKRRDAQFNELLVRNISNTPGGLETGPLTTPVDLRLGVGGYVANEATRFTVGAFQTTGRNLDAALGNPHHFFGVIDADGVTKFTRDGNFELSPQGNGQMLLTDDAGRSVINQANDAITLPKNATAIELNKDGNITGVLNGERRVLARIGVADIPNHGELTDVGGGLYTATGQYQNAQGNPLTVGTLESSNVDMGTEMTNLTQIQRAYQFNSKALMTTDQMMGIVTSLK
ncbi:flagellar hook-basal body protein [Exiguobacterium oxidotolerans]|uniref:flagellar hook-basal body protein n=1 Tax=Exiguobacterium oxidotolerans TaxID=223958 RepID=UPI000493F6A1|nr:flagellar hook-basal body protein [Exiguobacterium oxidotolerans]